MSKLKKIKGPIPVTLDKLLTDWKEYDNQTVLVENLIIDKIRFAPNQCVYIIAHHKDSSKKGFVYAYYKASVIARFSKPGDCINVIGNFTDDTSWGKHISTTYIENKDLDVDI
jgi:hypothetical protein